MDKDSILKQIDYVRDIKNHLWTGLLITVGGTLTLVFHLDSLLKIIFFTLGIIFSVIFFIGYFKKDEQIEFLFDKLNEVKE